MLFLILVAIFASELEIHLQKLALFYPSLFPIIRQVYPFALTARLDGSCSIEVCVLLGKILYTFLIHYRY